MKYKGETPLHISARLGASEAMVALLDSGADTKAKNGDGNTPLEVAETNNNEACVLELLKRLLY